MKQLSVTQYATELEITRQAVLAQIKDGRLPKNVKAEKIGNTWILVVK